MPTIDYTGKLESNNSSIEVMKGEPLILKSAPDLEMEMPSGENTMMQTLNVTEDSMLQNAIQNQTMIEHTILNPFQKPNMDQNVS